MINHVCGLLQPYFLLRTGSKNLFKTFFNIINFNSVHSKADLIFNFKGNFDFLQFYLINCYFCGVLNHIYGQEVNTFYIISTDSSEKCFSLKLQFNYRNNIQSVCNFSICIKPYSTVSFHSI